MNKSEYEHYLILEKKEDKFIFSDISNKGIPSLLRDYSAPVNLKTDLSFAENIHLLRFDDNLIKSGIYVKIFI